MCHAFLVVDLFDDGKRKYDDVEEEDSISDDLLNQHYDELEKQQYGGEISDDQLNELYDQLDQQQLDASI